MLHSAPVPAISLGKPPKYNPGYLQISADELESLKQAFRIFDSTGVGSIPLSQFKQIISRLNIDTNPTDIDLIACSFDINNDHAIDFEEFAAAMIHHLAHEDDATTPAEIDLMDCFHEFDKNRDGLISQAELEEVMTSLGERLSPQEIKAMIIEADTNKDGFIDFEEFKNLLPKQKSK